MRVSIHAPRQRNISYGNTIRRSIYETRWTKYPHSQIRRYKQQPEGPTHQPLHIKSCPDMAQICAKSTSTSILPAPHLMLRSLWALHHCIKSPSIAVLGIWHKWCHWNWKFRSGHSFQLHSTHRLQLNSTHSFRLNLTLFFLLFDSHLSHLFSNQVTSFD